MKSVISIIALVFSTSVFAANKQPQKFFCPGMGGNDEYVVYVDLSKKLAGFFDNDQTVTIAEKDMMILESNPPQYVYIFEGKDTASGEKDRLKIVFNQTRRTAYVVMMPFGEENKTLTSEEFCTVDNGIDL
jgi:hypothetical protein